MNNKKIIVFVTAFLLLFAGSAFGALYTGTWDPSWNPFALSPEEVMEEALAGDLFEEDVLSVSGSIAYSTVEDSGSEAMTLNIGIEGLVDKRDENGQKMQGNINGELGYMETTSGLDMDFIFNQNGPDSYDTYFKLNEMPFRELFEGFFSLPEGLEGQWFVARGNEGSVSIETYSGEFLEEDQDVEYIGTEKINGVSTYHYKVTTKGEAGEDLEGNKVPVDVWVGKKDKRVRKVLVDTVIKGGAQETDDENALGMELPGSELFQGESDARVRAELLFDYPSTPDKEITVPSDAKTLQELLN